MAGVTSAPVPHPPAKVDASVAHVTASDNKTTAAALSNTSISSDPTAAGAAPNTTPNNLGEQKKDRKPRRERLPLPDPIPTDPVKRYPEPSKADLLAAINVEDAKLQACFDRLNSTRAFYDERQKIRDAGKPAFDSARKLYNELNDQCRMLFDDRKEITAKLKSIKEADIAARNASGSGSSELVGAGKDGAEALKNVRTMEDLEQRIKLLEYHMETETLPMSEEKKIVAQIAFLDHKGRDFIMSKDQSFKDERAAKEHRISTRKELEEVRKQQDTLIDAAKAKVEAQKKVVDSIRAEQEAEIRKLQSATADIDRDAEKKKIGEIKGLIRKLRDEYQVKLDEWYLNERIHYEQQRIAKRKKYEAVQAEREARRKAWEEEQAQYPEPDPYQEQKDMCSGLTVYMQALLGETVDKPSVTLLEKNGVAPSLKTTSTTREITAKGKVIGKSSTGNDDGFESLAFSDFVKKSGKSKNRKGRRSAATPSGDAPTEAVDASLKPHSIDYIAAFTELGIKPPNKISEVRGALEQVKAKKAYYDAKPKPTDEEKAKMAASRSKKSSTQASEKKPKTTGADLMNGDGGAAAFPVLLAENAVPGSAPAPARDLSGPSFMAVASGAASAPPPTPNMPSTEMPSIGDVTAAGVVSGVEAIVADEPIVQGESLVASTELPLAEA